MKPNAEVDFVDADSGRLISIDPFHDDHMRITTAEDPCGRGFILMGYAYGRPLGWWVRERWHLLNLRTRAKYSRLGGAHHLTSESGERI